MLSSAQTHQRCVSRALRHGTHATIAALMLAMLIIPIPAWAAQQISSSPASASRTTSDPQPIEDFYTYDTRRPLEPRIAMLDSNEWYQHYDLQYQSEGDTVYSHYFVPVLPRSAGNPAIIGLHGMFSDSEQQFWMMAEFVAKRGIAGITPSMPYHHRFRTGVFVMAGSGVSGIAENSEHLLVAAFREIAKTRLLDPQSFVYTLQPVDPINVPDLYPRPVLMINGIKDTIMPPSESMQLLRSLGQAKQVWADSSHYFPAYAAEYLLASFLAEHMPESYGVPAPGSVLQAQPGWRFVEAVQPPVPGENRLWMNVEAQAPAAGTSSAHRVGVPMVNKVVPVIAVSADTLRAVETDLLKLPAFIHVMASDSLFDLAAACAYASALGLGHEPLLYYLAPSASLADASFADGSIATGRYTLMEFSTAHVELARPATAAVVVPAASAAPAASLPSPHDLCTSSATYSSASAAIAALASRIRWDKLKTLQHFENAPDEWPSWSDAPPSVSGDAESTQ